MAGISRRKKAATVLSSDPTLVMFLIGQHPLNRDADWPEPISPLQS